MEKCLGTAQKHFLNWGAITNSKEFVIDHTETLQRDIKLF